MSTSEYVEQAKYRILSYEIAIQQEYKHLFDT